MGPIPAGVYASIGKTHPGIGVHAAPFFPPTAMFPWPGDGTRGGAGCPPRARWRRLRMSPISDIGLHPSACNGLAGRFGHVISHRSLGSRAGQQRREMKVRGASGLWFELLALDSQPLPRQDCLLRSLAERRSSHATPPPGHPGQNRPRDPCAGARAAAGRRALVGAPARGVHPVSAAAEGTASVRQRVPAAIIVELTSNHGSRNGCAHAEEIRKWCRRGAALSSGPGALSRVPDFPILHRS